ncbi:hypothetical protein I0C86_12270, partial [Plantactinospora sp. S1510]|nr:hypothetical protein [Plantactinospora alkalitolerans]
VRTAEDRARARPPRHAAHPLQRSPLARSRPRPSRRRSLFWFLGGLGAIVLVATIAGGSWYAATRGLPAPSQSGSRGTTAPATTSATRIFPGGGALRGCLVALPGGARCPVELECFGPVRVRKTQAEAQRLSCSGRHTWESYAEGDLPLDVDATDHGAVKQDATVRGICNTNVFRLTTTLIDTDDWRFEVLPPSPSTGAAGPANRTFRCLAGKGVDQLTGPTLPAN